MSIRFPLLLIALFLIACPGNAPFRIVVESFEDVCEGDSLCEFEQVDGEPGDVTWIETIHPGEHGLRIEAGARLVRSYEPRELRSLGFQAGSAQGYITGLCEEGANIEVAIVMTDDLDYTDEFRGTSTLWTEYDGTSFALVGASALDPNSPLNTQGSVSIRPLALEIRVRGEGACEIDHLTVDSYFGGSIDC